MKTFLVVGSATVESLSSVQQFDARLDSFLLSWKVKNRSRSAAARDVPGIGSLRKESLSCRSFSCCSSMNFWSLFSASALIFSWSVSFLGLLLFFPFPLCLILFASGSVSSNLEVNSSNLRVSNSNFSANFLCSEARTVSLPSLFVWLLVKPSLEVTDQDRRNSN